MVTATDLQNMCVSWKADDIVGFTRIVRTTLDILGLYQRELAAEFEVSESTVSRWASGTSCPTPRMRKLIVAAISKHAGRAATRPGASSSGEYRIAAKWGTGLSNKVLVKPTYTFDRLLEIRVKKERQIGIQQITFTKFLVVGEGIWEIKVTEGSIISAEFSGEITRKHSPTHFVPITLPVKDVISGISYSARKQLLVGSIEFLGLAKPHYQVLVTIGLIKFSATVPSSDAEFYIERV